MRIESILKAIFFGLIFLQIIPPLFNSVINQYSEYFEAKTAVGLISFKHAVHDSSDHIKTLHHFFNNHDIKAILLWINNSEISPGSAQTLAYDILTLKRQKSKPIIAFCENNCTSWAYYLACATDYIIATPATLIGNILSKKNNTDIKVVDNVYKQFVEFAIKHRKKLSDTNSDQWAQGQLFTGSQALNLGLIDQIGSFSDACNKIKSLALIEGDIIWVKPKEKPSSSFTYLLQQLMNLLN